MTTVKVFLGSSPPNVGPGSFFCPNLSAADFDPDATFVVRWGLPGPGVRKKRPSGTLRLGALLTIVPALASERH